ncbi:MAG: cyclic pyranopterin monophosphate synthase MoaC [Deltaproteobacteria bacterium]|nr:cyclic pyranopterin monophosphate synthase MoaC [Deltaproteobacteria bacterium]
MSKLTHIDKTGKAKMVDVTDKPATTREAVATASIYMQKETLKKVLANEMKKGDVLGVARIAGILAAKKTDELIPLCHPLPLTSIDIAFDIVKDKNRIDITASVKLSGKTGVEMEALTAVTVAALTIYDMCKAADKGMKISDIVLLKKSGGRSGTYVRKGLRAKSMLFAAEG